MIWVPVVAVLAIALMAVLLRPWPFFLTAEERCQYFERNVAVSFAKWVERLARERGLTVRGVARFITMECHKCRKESNYFVYPDEVCERCWRASLKPAPARPSEHRP